MSAWQFLLLLASGLFFQLPFTFILHVLGVLTLLFYLFSHLNHYYLRIQENSV